jgi:Tfp pilus assembly protein PilP
MMKAALLACAVLAACGGDDDAPTTTQQPNTAPAGNAAAKKPDDPNKPKLTPRLHVEDRVACATPITATGPDCQPESATCDAGLYCLLTGIEGKGGYHCEPCPERESIRHEFKDRDFVAEQSRDPFESFVLVPAGLGQPNDNKPDLDKTCTRPDQIVAPNYSYEDLHLVGIVAQGTQRKALMMDTGIPNLGHIVKRNDCVGREKALVKDIGTGFVTFVITPDNDTKGARPPTEKTVPLYPNGLSPTMPLTQQMPATDQAPTTPVIAPPGSGSAAPKKP